MRKAATTFGVTYTILNKKITGKYSNFNGATTGLSRTCEALLATLIGFMADIDCRSWIESLTI